MRILMLAPVRTKGTRRLSTPVLKSGFSGQTYRSLLIRWNSWYLSSIQLYSSVPCIQFLGYPLLHSSPGVVHETVNSYSLLYIIKGTNSTLKPALFLAHIDVVPTTGQNWTSDPFDPTIRDGFLYARGTIDDKGSLFVSCFFIFYKVLGEFLRVNIFYFSTYNF